MGCRPRARSVLHCHGVRGLRQGPWTRADGRKKQGLKLVSRQFRKRRLALWAASRGLDPSFTAMVFEASDRVPWTRADGRKKQGLKLVSRQFRKRRLALWAASRGPDLSRHWHGAWGLRQGPWTRAGGRKKQGLKLVSRQFRKRRLALWAAGRGQDPSFTAMRGPWTRADGRKKQGLKLVSTGSSESDVWHYGLPAAGLIRPSLPWCLRPATGSLDPSWRQEKARFEASF